MLNKKEPLFSISVAARLLGITPRILRSYEEAELLSPYRTEGKTRLYSEQDLRKVQIIHYLHKEKEINLYGIKIIFEIISHMPKETVKDHDLLNLIKKTAPELFKNQK